MFALSQDGENGGFDPGCPVGVPEMAEHHYRRQNQGDRIGKVASSDVGCGAVDSFEHGDSAFADVGAAGEAKSADEAGAKVGDDVTVQVFHHHHVEALGPGDEL